MSDVKECTKCGETKPFSEFNKSGGGSLHSWCRPCHQKCERERVKPSNDRVNPKNNAISRVMGQRMVAEGLHPIYKDPKTGEDPHAQRRHELRDEIRADGSWKKYADQSTEPVEPKPKPKKIKKVRLPRRVKVESRWEWDTTGTCADLRDNLEITQGVCELTGVCFESCDTSHLTSQKQCKDLNRPDLIGEPDNAVLLDMRINRAMEPKYGFTFLESGQLIPPSGGEYYPWMVEAGIPDARIKVTEGRLLYIRLAAMGRAQWEDLA